MYRIFVVEDHAVMQNVISQMLQRMPNIELCGAASSAEEAFDRILTCQPDLLLTDVALPGMTGLELSQQLFAVQPNLPVLIVSGHERQVYAGPDQQNLSPNIKGYVMKHEGPRLLLTEIERVLRAGRGDPRVPSP